MKCVLSPLGTHARYGCVVAVLAAEHLATTDCCGVWSDLLASSRAEPPAAGKRQGKGRKPTRDVRLQDLLDAFEFATTSMEMSMEEVGTAVGVVVVVWADSLKR